MPGITQHNTWYAMEDVQLTLLSLNNARVFIETAFQGRGRGTGNASLWSSPEPAEDTWRCHLSNNLSCPICEDYFNQTSALTCKHRFFITRLKDSCKKKAEALVTPTAGRCPS